MRPPLLTAAALLLAVGCDATADKPGRVILPGMHESVPWDPYEPNPVFKGRSSLQHPPEGTVPFRGTTFPYAATPEDAERAGRELANPLEESGDVLERGQFIFETFCVVCHGPAGLGDGPVTGQNRFPNPPSLMAQRARSLPDGQLFHILSRGQGLMPPYVYQVRPADRWAVIRYVRKMQTDSPIDLTAAAAPPPADGAGTNPSPNDPPVPPADPGGPVAPPPADAPAGAGEVAPGDPAGAPADAPADGDAP